MAVGRLIRRAALVVAALGGTAAAQDRALPHGAPVAAFPTGDTAARASVPASVPVGVAAFPDLAPARPAPPPDPSLELLATNPYDDELARHKIAQNLYGEDEDDSNPYAAELRLGNPYTDQIRLANPYTEESRLINPYSALVPRR